MDSKERINHIKEDTIMEIGNRHIICPLLELLFLHKIRNQKMFINYMQIPHSIQINPRLNRLFIRAIPEDIQHTHIQIIQLTINLLGQHLLLVSDLNFPKIHRI
jgi:hypothetical protein